MLTEDQIRAKVNHGLYRSLTEIASYEPSVEGMAFGLDHLDKLTGGLRPRRLNIVAGYSHHGKTSLMLTGIVNNMDDVPALFITGDDPDDMVLNKIIAYREHIGTDEVEKRGAVWRKEYVEENIEGKLVLAGMKESYTYDELTWIYDLASNELGQPPEIVCFDYISMLRLSQEKEGFNDVRAKFNLIKQVIRDTPDSVWMVGHQCRKDAEDATALTLNHLEYGGHQQADGVIIGCRRKSLANMKDNELWEEEKMPRTYVSVMKNKINGRKSNNPVGHPYLIDPVSGIIREILDSDRPRPHTLPGTDARPSLALPKLGINGA